MPIIKKNKLTLILNFFVFIFLISCLLKFYSFHLTQSEWQYADWLINYQGGFIRRGFIGEILFQLHTLTGIGLDKLLLFFVFILYFVISLSVLKSIQYLNSKLELLIFFSPAFIIYSITNSEIIGRKEILLFAIIGIFVFCKKLHDKNFLFVSLIVFLFVLSLSHSGLLFYTPYLIYIFTLIKISKKDKIQIYEILLIVISLVTIFFLIYLNQGSKEQVSLICKSIKYYIFDNCIEKGQFKWLYTAVEDHIGVKFDFSFSVSVYVISLFLVFVFFFIQLLFVSFVYQNNFLNKTKLIYIYVLLFLFTLPIYVLGYDWGRYISMSYYCSFYIYILLKKENLVKINHNNFLKKFNLNNKIFYIFLIVYSIGWTFPFYEANKFKFPLSNPIFQLQKIMKSE